MLMVDGNEMEDRAVQPENAASPMVSTPSSRVTDVKPLQFKKHLVFNNLTVPGIEMEDRAVQPENAP